MSEPLHCYRHPDRETLRLVLRMRPADLRGLHDLRAGRDPLPGARERRRLAPVAARTMRNVAACDAAARGAGDDGADRDQRGRLPDHRRPRAAGSTFPAASCSSTWALRAPRSPTATGGVSSPRCSSTAASSTSLFNMLALYWLGTIVEQALGTPRFLLVYFVSGLAGSAGALWFSSPYAVTVGASGAIFGLIGALLILEYLATGSLMGQAMVLILVNLALTFAVPGHLDRRPPRRARRRHRRHLRADALPRYASRLSGSRSPSASASSASRSPTRACAATSPERRSLTGRTTSETPSIRTTSTVDALGDRPLVLGAGAPVLRADAYLAALSRPLVDRDHDDGPLAHDRRRVRRHLRRPAHRRSNGLRVRSE